MMKFAHGRFCGALAGPDRRSAVASYQMGGYGGPPIPAISPYYGNGSQAGPGRQSSAAPRQRTYGTTQSETTVDGQSYGRGGDPSYGAGPDYGGRRSFIWGRGPGLWAGGRSSLRARPSICGRLLIAGGGYQGGGRLSNPMTVITGIFRRLTCARSGRRSGRATVRAFAPA